VPETRLRTSEARRDGQGGKKKLAAGSRDREAGEQSKLRAEKTNMKTKQDIIKLLVWLARQTNRDAMRTRKAYGWRQAAHSRGMRDGLMHAARIVNHEAQ
jgi:hypothetical protein